MRGCGRGRVQVQVHTLRVVCVCGAFLEHNTRHSAEVEVEVKVEVEVEVDLISGSNCSSVSSFGMSMRPAVISLYAYKWDGRVGIARTRVRVRACARTCTRACVGGCVGWMDGCVNLFGISNETRGDQPVRSMNKGQIHACKWDA